MIFQTEQPYIRLMYKNLSQPGGESYFYFVVFSSNVCFGISLKWVEGALIVSAVYSL